MCVVYASIYRMESNRDCYVSFAVLRLLCYDTSASDRCSKLVYRYLSYACWNEMLDTKGAYMLRNIFHKLLRKSSRYVVVGFAYEGNKSKLA